MSSRNYSIINIREIIYNVGNLQKTSSLFEDYGGWNRVGTYQTDPSVLDFWELESGTQAEEVLIQSNHIENGQLRLIKFDNVKQEYIRSSQQPWDTGGIMDINLSVHKVAESFEALRELGFHGLSDPLLQVMGPFKLYDILMKGYDDIIIAFTHRLEPPMELDADINFPTHVYKSSITVKDLQEAKSFYVDVLGCDTLTEYSVKKDKPQENMFGLPHNLADKVSCNAVILSIHGGRDVDFQIVEFEGISGKDFSQIAKPPNRGFCLYRVEVENLDAYHSQLANRNANNLGKIRSLYIQPYGKVACFKITSPNGVIWEFFEKDN